MKRRALSHRGTHGSFFVHARCSRRFRAIAKTLGIPAALGAGALTGFGCDGGPDTTEDSNIAALKACHLLDGTVNPKDEPRACDPADTHKTTICHIPPGNPANAHTLCVGNPAVPAHLQNHGDYLGKCQQEQPCTGTGGSPGTSGGGASGTGGTTGTGGAAGGSSGTGGTPTIVGIG